MEKGRREEKKRRGGFFDVLSHCFLVHSPFVLSFFPLFCPLVIKVAMC